jgi:hypothetical protein
VIFPGTATSSLLTLTDRDRDCESNSVPNYTHNNNRYVYILYNTTSTITNSIHNYTYTVVVILRYTIYYILYTIYTSRVRRVAVAGLKGWERLGEEERLSLMSRGLSLDSISANSISISNSANGISNSDSRDSVVQAQSLVGRYAAVKILKADANSARGVLLGLSSVPHFPALLRHWDI